MPSDAVLRIKSRNRKTIELLKYSTGVSGCTQSRVRSPVTERRPSVDLSSAFSASLSLTTQSYPLPPSPLPLTSMPSLACRTPSQPCSPAESGDKVLTETSSNLHLTTACTSPPWYRFCRPVAPHPSASMVNSPSNSIESGSPSPTNEHGVSVVPTSHEASSPSLFQYTNLNQEQANWLASLPLPPPPSSSITALLYDSIDEEEELFGAEVLPPPPSRSHSPRLPAVTQSLSRPLTSVSNILHGPVSFGERLPKWSVLNCHVSDPQLSENLHTTASHDRPIGHEVRLPSPPAFVSSYFGRDSLDENVPLQTAHSTSRASPTTPPVPAFARHPNPLGALLEGFCFNPVAVPGLTRPTVLKREPPDGAEQDMNSSLFEHEGTDFHDPPPITKRSAGRPDSSECSHKKSRVNMLVPSENSAFLPVRSSRIT
ncbi:hypothetical protein SprV_0100365400 [Sparganum proliferum]